MTYYNLPSCTVIYVSTEDTRLKMHLEHHMFEVLLICGPFREKSTRA
jgi:hypothetical protein